MNDQEILQHIGGLVDEEHALYQRSAEGHLNDAEHARLRAIEVALDQCWDLLRQRRARREFGQDPNAAEVRDAEMVERYQQ
jgi:hypothetical protein